MSLPNAINFERGSLKGTIYDFLRKGDSLPMHDHTPESAHICVIAKGSLTVLYGDERTPTTHPQGQVLDPDYPHELRAGEDGTRIVSILKGL